MCPDCGRGNDTDANYCDQCDAKMTSTTAYARQDDEDVECPECKLYNDDDAHFCDQCGVKLEGRTDVQVVPMESGETTLPDPDVQQTDNPSGDSLNDGVSSQFASKVPRSNLVRDRVGGVELRANAEGQITQITGIFCEYNTEYEISSFWEGDFIERFAPGAFTDMIARVNADPESCRVLYDHGFDPQLGNKPLGRIRNITETADGPQYVVDLLDTSYNRDWVIPALSGQLISGERVGSQLGSSMRFEALEESWELRPPLTATNPTGLPVRTVTKADVREFGPVTFPANPGATAVARSRSDDWLEHLVGPEDSTFVATLAERVGVRGLQQLRQSVPADVVTRRVAREAKRRQNVLQNRARALLLLSGA